MLKGEQIAAAHLADWRKIACVDMFAAKKN